MSLNLRQIPSPNYGGYRGTVKWIIVHTAEGALTVDALGNFFANPASGVSSHVGIDDHGIAQYVPYTGTAWTALNANPYSDQAELCAFAAWTRAEWLTHTGMLENCAQWIADRCKARGIPAVKVGPADVGRGQAGVIGHVDVTYAPPPIGGGSHTDPGTSFPWDVVMARVNAILSPPAPAPTVQEDDMAYIIKASGRASAVLVAGSFIGLAPGTDEEKNWISAGAPIVWVTAPTWDAYANGDAFRVPASLQSVLVQIASAAVPVTPKP